MSFSIQVDPNQLCRGLSVCWLSLRLYFFLHRLVHFIIIRWWLCSNDYDVLLLAHATPSIVLHNDQWLIFRNLDTCCEPCSRCAFRRLNYTSHRIQLILSCLHEIAEPATLLSSSFPDRERVDDLAYFSNQLRLFSICSSFDRGIFVLLLGHHGISFCSLRLNSVIVSFERHGFKWLITPYNLLDVLQSRLCILNFLHLLLLKYFTQTVDDLHALFFVALFMVKRGRCIFDENLERANCEFSQWNTFR